MDTKYKPLEQALPVFKEYQEKLFAPITAAVRKKHAECRGVYVSVTIIFIVIPLANNYYAIMNNFVCWLLYIAALLLEFNCIKYCVLRERN